MAALVARSAASTAVVAQRPQRQAVKAQAALRPSVQAAPAVSTAGANQMMVWQPINNKCVVAGPRCCARHLIQMPPP